MFQQTVEALVERPSEVQRGAQMVYLLRNMGAHINRQDEVMKTAVNLING